MEAKQVQEAFHLTSMTQSLCSASTTSESLTDDEVLSVLSVHSSLDCVASLQAVSKADHLTDIIPCDTETFQPMSLTELQSQNWVE